MECASSDVNGLTSWAMLDLEVLHCPICFEPLTIPIFEVAFQILHNYRFIIFIEKYFCRVPLNF
ncbi:unnamed protein product [Arabidopsis lyrata]|uniref:Predicted protein n=1 Tax=Arabidopsis lyrata subsp. lyrata TaxID=81972 RepID=D7MIK7_ARALL|nr:predicted protein [Arabidopsis lyrata subsp. lyrata]CAH8277330.1 unnamed protein product [Arabidopsis lyrata]